MHILTAAAAKIFAWILSKIWNLAAAAAETYRRRKKIDAEAAESVEPLKKAQSDDDIEKASDPALDHW